MTSCREDFEFQTSSGNLEFSKDTVYLDTVFTNIGSSTYRLKVYNRSNKDIKIPSIKLGRSDSKYRMMIDGMQGTDGKSFNNIELLAKDSLFIFIETTIDYNDFAGPDAQFLYTDQIQFDSGSNLQTVELVTLVKDAVFLYPARDSEGNYETLPIGDEPVPGFFLEGDELHWTSAKPYVIYGYAAVPPNATLEVDPGARVHFHADAALIASNASAIKINGTIENNVIFEGDRLENAFSDIPGQWSAIWLTQGSTGHDFKNLTIKNATVGILVSGNTGLNNVAADLNLENVQIYNSANAGILAQTGYISGNNVVINYAGSSALYCNYGGKYKFTHSTFNNNWSGTNKFALRIDNFIEGANPLTQALVDTKFENCIIYSTNQSGLALVRENDGLTFAPIFTKCVIKLSDNSTINNNPLYAFMADEANIKRNKNPNFIDANQNNLMIGEESSAINFGNNLGGSDINGNARSQNPDVGAYNYIPE